MSDKFVLSGNAEQGKMPCTFCGLDLSGRTHATAIISHALDECRVRLKAQRDDLRDIVDELQWSSSSQDSEMSERVYSLCPSCGWTRVHGHSETCEIGLTLAETESKVGG
jgi:hypothetical protein